MSENKQNLNLTSLLKEKVQEVKNDKTLLVLWISFISLSVIVVGLQLSRSPGSDGTHAAASNGGKNAAMDEFIPDGLTLFPVTLSNGEAINSLISESGGLVDLYTSPSDTNKSIRIAKKVKIVRTGVEGQFAVLIPSDEGHILGRYPGPFIASVLNVHSRTEGLERQSTIQNHNRPEILYGKHD